MDDLARGFLLRRDRGETSFDSWGECYQALRRLVDWGLCNGNPSLGLLGDITEDGRRFLDLCRDGDVWLTVAWRIRSAVESAPLELWENELRDEVECRIHNKRRRISGFARLEEF